MTASRISNNRHANFLNLTMDLDPTAGKELKKLEKYIRGLKSYQNYNMLEGVERKALLEMQDALSLAVRLHSDATKADRSDVMLVSLERCAEQLVIFNDKLLFASQFDLVDSVDVAQLSSTSEHIRMLITGR